MKSAFEVNFDGLVGPTHNYGGLAYGNVASIRHGLTVSNPRAALFQGLEKMKLLHGLGLKQAILPPHERPDVQALRRLGFYGSEASILEQAAKQDPFLLASCYSSSGMWAANAATVSPSADTQDRRVHMTAANLVSQFHRSIEAAFTSAVLKTIFSDETAFVHHDPLPATLHFSDEGAANHTRLCSDFSGPGIEFFVYGRKAFDRGSAGPARFPARQSHEASAAIARLHRLDPHKTILARQSAHAIDSGVFHNDVIAVGNRDVLLCHEHAFAESPSLLDDLKRTFAQWCNRELILIEAKTSDVTVPEAVDSYLFNSQLVTLPNGAMMLIAPVESEENPKTRSWLARVVTDDNPIGEVRYVDVRQSMKNGGGPACLRLRVVLTEREMQLSHPGVFFTDELYGKLKRWGERSHRERLHVDDLADPKLPQESRTALDELTQILQLGSIYAFQRYNDCQKE